MSGKRVTFIGDAMAAVVQAVEEVRTLLGQPPVVVGGLAVMCRLSRPYRATTDLDVVDRLLGATPQLQVLRSARGAEPVEPTSVLLPTVYGKVKVDVLEVRQIEIDQPSDDPGDRLHASAHAWATDTVTEVTIAVASSGLWLVDRRRDALRWIHDTSGTDLTLDDLDLIAELLLSACARLVTCYRLLVTIQIPTSAT